MHINNEWNVTPPIIVHNVATFHTKMYILTENCNYMVVLLVCKLIMPGGML